MKPIENMDLRELRNHLKGLRADRSYQSQKKKVLADRIFNISMEVHVVRAQIDAVKGGNKRDMARKLAVCLDWLDDPKTEWSQMDETQQRKVSWLLNTPKEVIQAVAFQLGVIEEVE